MSNTQQSVTSAGRLVKQLHACIIGRLKPSSRHKATFHYSSQLQTWLQPWFSTRFTARFSTSSCGLRHAFDTLSTFVSKTWSRTCCINLDEIDAAGSQQVCWFVRVLDKWNVEKNRFKQVRSWLSRCFRPACDTLTQVCDQVCSLLE